MLARIFRYWRIIPTVIDQDLELAYSFGKDGISPEVADKKLNSG
jgi:hypothetical protein